MADDPHSTGNFDLSDRGVFLNLAGAVEGGMVLAALLLAWLAGIDLWTFVRFDARSVWQSLLAVLPLLVLFAITYRWPWGPLKRIKDLLLDVLGPSLAACRWYDLPLLAFLAGLGEQLLFRGVIQLGIAQGTSPAIGLVVASVIFGVAHAVTPTYAVLAGMMGLYLGGLLHLEAAPNLTPPILVHAVYDLVAFVILRRDYRLSVKGGGQDGKDARRPG